MGKINWVGLWTLCRKEVARFLVVYNQTLAAPLVTTLLFLAIFTLALGRGHTMVGDVPFDVFLAPGLIMMSMIQNSFCAAPSLYELSCAMPDSPSTRSSALHVAPRATPEDRATVPSPSPHT